MDKSEGLLLRLTRHALKEPHPGLLVEDGVWRAAGVACHKLLNKHPDLSFNIVISNSNHISPCLDETLFLKKSIMCVQKFVLLWSEAKTDACFRIQLDKSE